MFGIEFQKRRSKLDEPINKVLEQMEIYAPVDPEYEVLLGRLAALTELQDKTHSLIPSPDTMAIAAANLLGILAILKFEQTNVVVSKALGMLLRTKLDR